METEEENTGLTRYITQGYVNNLHEVDLSDRAFNTHDDSLLVSTTLKILGFCFVCFFK